MRADFPPSTGSRVRLGQHTDFNLSGLRVRPARREVTFDGETRILEPRVMQVLVALAERRPAVISRDELAQACWGGLNVGDDAMNRCVVALRRLARDFEPQPYTIETVPRVGYSLIETEAAREAPAPADGATGSSLGGALPLTAMVLAIAAIFAAISFVSRANKQQNRIDSLAVVAASSDPSSESLARDLTAKLGMLDSVSQGTVRLLDESPADADLLFQVDAATQGSNLYCASFFERSS